MGLYNSYATKWVYLHFGPCDIRTRSRRGRHISNMVKPQSGRWGRVTIIGKKSVANSTRKIGVQTLRQRPDIRPSLDSEAPPPSLPLSKLSLSLPPLNSRLDSSLTQPGQPVRRLSDALGSLPLSVVRTTHRHASRLVTAVPAHSSSRSGDPTHSACPSGVHPDVSLPLSLA